MSSKSQIDLPPPIKDYGCPKRGQSKLYYDRWAFGIKAGVESGCPMREKLFEGIADQICPGYFEWHDWTRKMIKGLCYEQWVGIAGAAGCVAGHTRIPNPITGEEPTIQYLCENGIAPVVMTLSGPAQAGVPFVKGSADLYEVVLSNGQRFEATAEHRVLACSANATPLGYEFVGNLCIGRALLSYGTGHLYGAKLQQVSVVSIRRLGAATYYDISVPIHEHYFSSSCIHHNSAKSYNIAGYAASWWLCAPCWSSVIFCSTTTKALRKRGWSYIQTYFSMMPQKVGNFVNSEMSWQAEKGDHKHAIMGVAVEEGQTWRVADNIKGVHTERQLVIIDEATAIPHAIMDACSNLHSVPYEFILVMLGNPRSRLDEFGLFCEPVNGWNSVNPEIDEWETKPKLNGVNGICIRFDIEKSPNIITPPKDGKLWHVPTKEIAERARQSAGYEHDPLYWSNFRGFWPPEGLTKNVFSSVALENHDGYGKHKFTGNNFRIIGSLDPARAIGTTGKPVLRFAALGEIDGGDWGVEVMPPIIVPLNAKSSNPIDYQIVEQCRRECENVTYRGNKYPCDPANFGVDATGGGAGLCDIAQRIWSHDIIRIGFGESASEDPVSYEDIRPANTVYRNKRVEMFFRSANALDSNQLKGIDQDTAKELCTLTFDDSKPLITIMPKDEFRKVFGCSSDYADSLCMILEVARIRGFRLAARGETVKKVESFSHLLDRIDSMYEDGDHSCPEELDEEYADSL